jgi:hypothetical protein
MCRSLLLELLSSCWELLGLRSGELVGDIVDMRSSSSPRPIPLSRHTRAVRAILQITINGTQRSGALLVTLLLERLERKNAKNAEVYLGACELGSRRLVKQCRSSL